MPRKPPGGLDGVLPGLDTLSWSKGTAPAMTAVTVGDPFLLGLICGDATKVYRPTKRVPDGGTYLWRCHKGLPTYKTSPRRRDLFVAMPQRCIGLQNAPSPDGVSCRDATKVYRPTKRVPDGGTYLWRCHKGLPTYKTSPRRSKL